MNEDVRVSRERVSRRRALGLGGTLGLGALLAACGGDDGSGSSSLGTPSAPTGSTTASGATSTAESATGEAATGSRVLAMLDQANTCTTALEETQGPYWFDVDSIRRDIREDRPGTTLDLAIRVHDVSACSTGGDVQPVRSCVVEIWHCDAGGAYSGFESGAVGGVGGGPPGGPPGGQQGGSGGDSGGDTSDGSYSVGDAEAQTTDDGTYLRGAQVADDDGVVRFTTIYPGWYQGRTVHIHVKVHIDKATVLTTQLFMADDVSDEAFAASPYDEHTGRDTINASDSIFDESGLVTIEPTAGGYLAVINLGVDS